MDYRTFGRTGLRVSVVGLGAGGPSKLGRNTGRSEEESIAVARRALELGINYIDTAENYGTEEIVGKAILGRRPRQSGSVNEEGGVSKRQARSAAGVRSRCRCQPEAPWR